MLGVIKEKKEKAPKPKKPKDPRVDDDGFAVCTECKSKVQCGPGGWANLLSRHLNSKTCKAAKLALDKNKSKQTNIFGFFARRGPSPPPNPSTTHVTGSILATEGILLSDSDDCTSVVNPNTAAEASKNESVHILVEKLQRLVDALPMAPPDAPAGRLACFAQDPALYDQEDTPADELWEGGLNELLKSGLGWGTELDVPAVVDSCRTGLDGLIQFLGYFIKRGVDAGMLEGKLTHLFDGLKAAGRVEDVASKEIEALPQSAYSSDVEIIPNSSVPGPQSQAKSLDATPAQSPGSKPSQALRTRLKQVRSISKCIGHIMHFEDGISPHTVYPFALHDLFTLPWGYEVINNVMTLRARECTLEVSAVHIKDTPPASMACLACQNLGDNSVLRGILSRIENGTHESARYPYHSIANLIKILRQKDTKIRSLGAAALTTRRTLLSRSAALSEYKRFVVAIGSGRYENVDRLVRIALGQKRGIRAILGLYEAAATGVYHPKSYTEKDDMRGLLLWKLGGNRIAGIAHRALGLPEITTLRHRAIMPPLIPSHTIPTTMEVTANLQACFESIRDVLLSREVKIIHSVMMVDEIATEKRIRWDDETNAFLGVCRQHGMKTALHFNTVDDLEELFHSLETGEVHYAAEATVVAHGILSEDTRIYAGRPIMISGDCKRETGQEHSSILQTAIDSTNTLELGNKHIRLRTVSLASDGETRRGAALIQMTFKKKLLPSSSIYQYLTPLKFMNFWVGDDDLTCDKDWKHVVKRFRNLLLRSRGVVVLDTRITPAVIQTHLKLSGKSAAHVHSLFNPEDKQDVKLAFDLLKDIWSLSPLDDHPNPSVTNTRYALRILGKLLYHFIFPFLCVDLTLSEQLEQLSAASQLALGLFNLGSKDFIPTLLYQDLQMVIKNAFFCIAKAKVDDPYGVFFIIILGTDRLEEIFGILRTMIGNDTNLDIYQLASRLTGTTQVSNILAKYPEWDRPPRRLKLPALTRDSETLPDTVDHIKPASWKGDVHTQHVTLLTCWRRGRRLAEEDAEFLAPLLFTLDTKPEIDILSPRGRLLVNIPHDELDVDESLDIPDPPTTASPTEEQSSVREAALDSRVEIEDSFLEDNDNHSAEAELSTPTAATASKFPRYITYNGVHMLKPRTIALRSKLKGRPGPTSTDRLKRIAHVDRFSAPGNIIPYDSHSDHDTTTMLLIQDPVAGLVRCDRHVFLFVGEVVGIKVDADALLTSVRWDDMKHLDKVVISVQLFGLRPANAGDDESLTNDWRTYTMKEQTVQISGQNIQAVNPDLVSRGLYGSITSESIKKLPSLAATSEFPYREVTGKSCFACQSAEGGLDDVSQAVNACLLCTPPFEYGLTIGRRILEHNAAHILHDASLSPLSEPCGLCLRPSSICRVYVTQKGNTMKINKSVSSGCPNMHNFRYSSAAVSKASAPCSNVPVICPVCPALSPAIWKYNLQRHITVNHSDVPAAVDRYSHLWELSKLEKQEVHRFWKDRSVAISRRAGKAAERPAVVISDAHTMRADTGENIGETSTNVTISASDFQDQDRGLQPSSDSSDSEELPFSVSLHKDMSPERYPTPEIMPMDLPPIDAGATDIPPPSIPPPNNASTNDVEIPQNEELRRTDAHASASSAIANETGGRPQRRRTRYDLAGLELCLCGRNAKDDEASTLIECRIKTCETKWYHLECVDLEHAGRNWTCNACSSEGGGRAGKRSRQM